MAFALAVALWAYRLTDGARAAHKRWDTRLKSLDARLERADAIVGAYSGVVIVWESDDDLDAPAWSEPKAYGSDLALGALLRFVDASDGPDVVPRVLDGLSDYEARDALGADTTLRRALAKLYQEGAPFSMTIMGPSGRFIEAHGRPAGGRLTLWLTDSTIRQLDISKETTRIEENRRQVGEDPDAFINMLARAPFPVWRLSSGLKLEWANEAYLRAVGADSLNDAISRDLMFDAEIKDQARVALESEGRAHDARAVVVADGSRRHFSISLFHVSAGATGLAIDTTREVVAREELERYAQAQEDALNRLDEAVAVFDADQNLTFHNNAFAKLFDLDPAWLRGGVAHGALLDHLRERRLLTEASNADYPSWRASELARYGDIHNLGGEEIWSLPDKRILRVSSLRHPLGGLLVIFSDVTETVTLEQKYNTQIRVQTATLDKLAEGVAVFGSNGTLRLHNAAFEKLWELLPGSLSRGVTFDELIGLCKPVFHDLSAWNDLKARITDVSPETRQPSSGEWEQPATGRILSYISRPLPDGDTLIAFADITAARTLAEALQERAAALMAADKIKSDFVGHVSYQLRAPLQTILGYAELLKRSLGPDLPERETGQLGAILLAVAELNKLVEDILDIAAIEAGTVELEVARMEVRPALESAVNLAQSNAEHTQVRVTIGCPPEVGAIYADAKRIKQVVYNLLLNALQHSEPGETVSVGAVREGPNIQLWVEDEGVGISPADQARVFEPWERGRGRGAGLGLALVREFVEMHGGWVDLMSEQGKGTRVTCHLPETPPPPREDDEEDGESGEPGGGAPLRTLTEA